MLLGSRISSLERALKQGYARMRIVAWVDASVYKQSGFKLEGHGDMMNHHCIHLSLIPPTCKLIPCTMDDSRVYSLHWTEEIHMLMKDKPGSASFFVGFLSAK